MPDEPVPSKPKNPAWQVKRDLARKAARRATNAAVFEFEKERTRYETRTLIQRDIFDHVPALAETGKGKDAYLVCIAVSRSDSTCTATLWFDLPDGAKQDANRDKARILLAHLLAIAIANLVERPEQLSQQEEANGISSVGKLRDWAYSRMVAPESVTVTNFPGPYVSTATQPANTQVRLELGAASPLLSESLAEEDVSDRVLATFVRLLAAYGYTYVGSTELGSKSARTTRTRLCVARDPRLFDPARILLDRNGRLLKTAEFQRITLSSQEENALKKASDFTSSILDRIAMAAIAMNKALMQTQSVLKFLVESAERYDEYIEVLQPTGGLEYAIKDDVDLSAFFQWVGTVASQADLEFGSRRQRIKKLIDGVCVKILNVQSNTRFSSLERLYLKHVFLFEDDERITRDVVTARLENSRDPRNAPLRACKRERDRKNAARAAERAARDADKDAAKAAERAARAADKAKQAQLRRAIIEVAMLGWGNRRQELTREHLEYLLTLKDFDGKKYIKRNVASGTLVEEQAYVVNDGAALIARLLEIDARLLREVNALKKELKRRACAAILENATLFDLLVADYLKHVIEIPGFDVDGDGNASESAREALQESRFATQCRRTKAGKDKKQQPEDDSDADADVVLEDSDELESGFEDVSNELEDDDDLLFEPLVPQRDVPVPNAQEIVLPMPAPLPAEVEGPDLEGL